MRSLISLSSHREHEADKGFSRLKHKLIPLTVKTKFSRRYRMIMVILSTATIVQD